MISQLNVSFFSYRKVFDAYGVLTSIISLVIKIISKPVEFISLDVNGYGNQFNQFCSKKINSVAN